MKYAPVTKKGLFEVSTPLQTIVYKFRAIDVAEARCKFARKFNIGFQSDFYFELKVTEVEATKRQLSPL